MTSGEAPTTPTTATTTTIAFVTTITTTRVNLVVTGKEEEIGIGIASVVLDLRTPVLIARVGRRLHHRVRSLIVAAKDHHTSVVVDSLSTATTQHMHVVLLAPKITEVATDYRRGKQTERPNESLEETLRRRHHRRQNAKGHEARHLAARTIIPFTLHSTDAIPVISLNTVKGLVEEDSRSVGVTQVAVDSVEEAEEAVEEEHPGEGETGEGTILVA